MHLRLRRALLKGSDVIDPFRTVSRLPLQVPPATLLSVYRRRNEDRLVSLLLDLPGVSARFWALDSPAPALEGHTCGVGPGGRFELLNRLAGAVPPDHWLLICDDDVALDRRGAGTLLALAARLHLDLAQPAHANRGSHFFHPITGRRPFRLARETTFVEIGPVLVIAPDARPRLLPFPTVGMGWGTELLWFDLQQAGMRLGIVDATPMRHLAPVGGGYDLTAESDRQQRMFDERGLTDWRQVQRTVRSRFF